MLVLLKSACAEQDIWEIAEYISRDNLEAGLRFVDALEETFLSMRQFPEAGPKVRFENPRLEGWRFRIVKGFSAYLIFYHHDTET